MKKGQKVSYLNCDFFVKECATGEDHVILKSVNRNCEDVLVHVKNLRYVRSGHYAPSREDRQIARHKSMMQGDFDV